MDDQRFLADLNPLVYVLEAKDNFLEASKQERFYAHYMSQASFHGARIILRQVSPESENIFDIIMGLSRLCKGNWSALATSVEIEYQQIDYFLDYACAFLDSLGNYRGYGDTKIIPRIEPSSFERLCSASEDLAKLYASCVTQIFSRQFTRLGLPDSGGQSGYFPNSPDITAAEIQSVQKVLFNKSMDFENTRLRKLHRDNKVYYEVLVASAGEGDPLLTGSHFDPEADINIIVSYGDHQSELEQIIDALFKAENYTRDENQRLYLTKTIEHLQTGDIGKHKEASIAWVKDQSAPVETFIGFMESYRDPAGLRSEWEGLVALQNRQQTKVLSALNDQAESFVRLLPWCQSAHFTEPPNMGPFENEKFMKPDFVSLDILAFCVSNVWTGITGPNYREVRNKYGRKNISLSNRLLAVHILDKVPFIKNEDLDDYRRMRHIVFQVIVAAHELIGHGCGKILAEVAHGEYNFDIDHLPVNPLTAKPVDSWYKLGETPKSLFGKLLSSYTECLAESIALYVIAEASLLEILDATSSSVTVDDILYNGYLQTIWMGLRGLLSYDPDSKRWSQAHDQARFAILKHLLQPAYSPTLLHIDISPGNLTIHLSRSHLRDIGHAAMRALILELHIYRSTANVVKGRELFEGLSTVEGDCLLWREAVVAQRQPRPLFVMGNTVLENADGKGDETISWVNYEATKEGLIQSWTDRNI